MDRHQIRVSNRKRILVHAMAFAALVLLPISCGKGGNTPPQPSPPPPKPLTAITFNMTVSGTGNADTVSYPPNGQTPPPADDRCGKAPPLNPGDIFVCQGDAITFQGETDGNQHELVIFVAGNILGAVASGPPPYGTTDGTTLRAKDNAKTLAATVTVTSQSAQPPYHYYVSIYDKHPNHPHMYSGDPVIIVGGGT